MTDFCMKCNTELKWAKNYLGIKIYLNKQKTLAQECNIFWRMYSAITIVENIKLIQFSNFTAKEEKLTVKNQKEYLKLDYHIPKKSFLLASMKVL